MKTILIVLAGAVLSLGAIAQDTRLEFIKIAGDNWHFETSESHTPFTPFGTNYYDPESYGTHEVWDNPAFNAPNVIGNFDSTRTRAHFAQLQNIGVNIIRIFFIHVRLNH